MNSPADSAASEFRPSPAAGVPRLVVSLRRIEAAVLSCGILLTAGLTIANVFSRLLFGRSLAFTEELAQFAIIAVTFVGLSYAAGRGRHIRMTALYDQLPQRWQKLLMVVILSGTAVLMFLLAWFCVRYLRTMADLGSVSPVLQIPLWIVYLAAPVGLTLAGMQNVLAVFYNLTHDGVWLACGQRDEYDEPVSGGI